MQARALAVISVVGLIGCFGGGGGTADIPSCKKSCDDGKLFNCLTADEQARCRSSCATTPARDRSDFVACQEASLPECDARCYAHLGISVGSGCSAGDITVCQNACDTLQFFACIDAATLAACRGRCTTSSMTSCTNFSACVGANTECTVLLDCFRNFR